MKYFRIKTGYGKNDFISIDETELAKALKCMIKGGIAIFEEGTIAGKAIMTIVPDWQKVMGYNRDYDLQGEDYQHIGETRQREYRNLISETQKQIEIDNENNLSLKRI